MSAYGQPTLPGMISAPADESKPHQQRSLHPSAKANLDEASASGDEVPPVNEAGTSNASALGASSSPSDGDESPEPENESQLPVKVSSADRRLYYLTNRLNLNGILSWRIVGPRESYRKHYSDLLDRCPGWVPLSATSPTKDMLAAVTAERGSGAPVIIEFPYDLPGVAGSDGSATVFAPAVLLAHASAVHFEDDSSVREHKARSYSNAHAHDDLIRVTPHLFAGETEKSGPVRPPETAATVDWQRVDRIRGAVSAAVAAAATGEELAMAAASLGAPLQDARVDIPAWLSWSELNDLEQPIERSDPTPQGHADLLTFRAVYEILATTDAAESWSPRRTLDAVATAISDSAPAAADTDLIARNLRRVREILDVEREFEPFRATGNALAAAKAMLLVLLRPDLGELIAWPLEETGADDVTRMTSAVFAGRLRGLVRENVELRSRALDDATAEWAARIARRAGADIGEIEFMASANRTELTIDGEVLRVCPPATLGP